MTTVLDVDNQAKFYWGAVLAGITVVIAVQSLFNLLGLGLGFIAFNADADTAKNLGIGSIVWWVVTSIVTMFIGGLIAGKASAINTKMKGGLHGLVVWASSTLLIFMLLGTAAGAIVSGTFSMLEQSVSAMGKGGSAIGASIRQTNPQITKTVQNMLPDLSPVLDDLTQQATADMPQTINANSSNDKNANTNNNETDSGATKTKLAQGMKDLALASSDDETTTARQKLQELLVANNSMSQQQAEEKINAWQNQLNQAKEKISQKSEEAKQATAEAAERASNALGGIALAMFFISLLGAVTAVLGGVLGVRNHSTI